MSNRLTRLFTEPLVQFLIIGACIYGAYALFGTPEEDFRDTTIIVDANRIDSFIGQWESRWNRPPTRQEIDGIIQQYVREDILYRQAVAMGLNEDDPITRRRMAQKLEFLTSDLAMMKQPAEGELEQYFQDNRTKYREPDQISFSQVFFDPDAREEATLDDAAEVLVQLRSAGEPDAQTLEAGDQFMLQGYFPSVTEAEVGPNDGLWLRRGCYGTGTGPMAWPRAVRLWRAPGLRIRLSGSTSRSIRRRSSHGARGLARRANGRI